MFEVVNHRNLIQTQTEMQARNQADIQSGQSLFSLSGENYAYAPTIYWTETLYSDFTDGTFSQTTATGEGSVTLNTQPYVNGTYTSNIFDSGYDTTNYTTLSWTSVLPGTTGVQFQTRCGNTTAGITSASFAGQNGLTSGYYTVSGTQLNESMNYCRYLQYRANLTTQDTSQTPELQAVSIGVTRPVGVIELNVTNSGATSFIPNATDVYIGGIRVARNDTLRTLTLHDNAGQALWDPGETLQIDVYKNIGVETNVIVASGSTKTSGSVGP